MKSEIDQLMAEDQIDLLWVTGSVINNSAMMYVTGGGHITHADFIKKRGESGILFCSPMERDEAAKTGMQTRCYDSSKLTEYLSVSNGNQIQAQIMLYEQILWELDFQSGRVALFGQVDVGAGFAVFSGLSQKLPDIEFVGYKLDGLILNARATKALDEVERIRNMGKVTIRVTEKLVDFLTHCPVSAGVLMYDSDQPVTVSRVKRKIDLWLAEEGVDNPEGTIFSLGRDGAVPHSTGKPTDLIREGVPIVFDIFPCEKGGGYFHDFTRTWCLGYAPDEVCEIYEDVLDVYQTLVGQIRIDQPFYTYHKMTCDLFEKKGHATVLTNPKTQEGFVHGLGHGVGLDVHELPYYHRVKGTRNNLKAGSVFAIEPGLYYPDQNIGVRLENTFWMKPDGEIENLAEYPLDLVLSTNS